MTHPTALPLDVLLARRPFVKGLANALVHDPGTAEDIEQEAWLTALRRPPAPGGSVRGWFSKVLRNEARDSWRAGSRRTRREHVAGRREALPSTAELVAREELHRRVVLAVHTLSEPYRSTVYLRFFEGLTNAEIAERDGVSQAAVRKRMERALAQLRERLDDEHDGNREKWLGGLVLIATDHAVSRPVWRLGATSIAAAAACALVAALGWAWMSSTGTHAPAVAPIVAAAPAVSPPVAPPPEDGQAQPEAGDDAGDSSLAGTPAEDDAAVADDATEAVAATGFTISVVDEKGVLLRAGTIRIETDVESDAPTKAHEIAKAIPTEVDLADANPFRLGGLSPAARDVRLHVEAFPSDRPPVDDEWIDLEADAVVVLELVAPIARSVTVRVLGPKGDTPIAAATVISGTEAGRRGLRAQDLRGVSGPASAITGDDGRAVLEHLGGGRHNLVVRAAGRQSAFVAMGDQTEVTIRLPEGKTGTVIAHCTWLNGEPNAGTLVWIGEDTARIGEDGTWRFEDIPVGRRQLFLFEQMIGKAAYGQAPAVRSGAWMGEHDFDLAAGETVEVGVGLVQGDASLEIEFVDASGEPRPAVHVALINPGIRTADCGADGIVRFQNLPAGALRYDVQARSGGRSWTRRPARLQPGETRRERIVIGTATVAGTIAAGTGVAPLKARIVLESAGRKTTIGSRDGRFAFDDVPSGPAWLVATANGLRSYPVQIEVGVESPAETHLEILPGGRAAFRAEGVATASLRDARGNVWTFVEHGELRHDVSRDGPLVVSAAVAPGRYELELTGTDGTSRSVMVEIESAGRTMVSGE